MPPGEARTWGRGSVTSGDGSPRLDFARHRPAKITLMPPLGINSISRSQLVLRAVGRDLVEVKNVGRAELLHNGVVTSNARVAPGDTVQVGRQLLFLCVERPAWLGADAATLADHAFGAPDANGLVGESTKMWDLRRTLAFSAGRSNHILIEGPTGTGKELVARGIYAASARSGGRFISRNAATIPETLVDAELFGNAKNYPNPGMLDREGLIGEADGGVLFLDEFGEMGQAADAHLLRVLDHGEYQRLGEARVRQSRFRLVAATNRDPSAIKHDLLARLALRITTPSLNERREDVPLIANHLLRQMAVQDVELKRFFAGGDTSLAPTISLDCMRMLVMHNYSANVRELLGLLLDAIRMTDGDELQPPGRWALAATPSSRSRSPVTRETASTSHGAPELFLEPTPQQVQASLDENNGALELTWRALGLSSRHVLRRLIQKHHLEVRRRGGQ